MVRDLKWQVSGMPCFDSVDQSRWWLLGDRWVKESSPSQWFTAHEVATQVPSRSLQRAIQEGPETSHPAAQALLARIIPEPPIPQTLTVRQVQEAMPQFTWRQVTSKVVSTPHPVEGSIFVSLVEGLYEYTVGGGHKPQATTSLLDASVGITRVLTEQRDLLNQALKAQPPLQVKDAIEEIAELLSTKGFLAFNFKHDFQKSDCALSRDGHSFILEVRPVSVALKHNGLISQLAVDTSNRHAAEEAILLLWDKAWRNRP